LNADDAEILRDAGELRGFGGKSVLLSHESEKTERGEEPEW